MSRSVGWRLLLGVLVAPIPAAAQPATVALLCVGACPAPPFDAGLPMFVSTLRDAGYVDGQNVVLDPRGIGDTPEQLPMLATQLVRRKVDVVVAIGAAAVVAARRASATVPLVMLHVPNAVELGLMASLARPGGNVTGVTFPLAELSAKHMELLQQIAPARTSVSVLWNPATAYGDLARRHAEAAGRSVGLQVRPLEIRDWGHLDRVLAPAARERGGALPVVEDDQSVSGTWRREINLFALEQRVPVIAWSRAFATAGAFMSYGPDRTEMHRLAATIVAKILQGKRPADIPVEQPTRYELVVNLATAKAIGVTIPPSVLARADEVIQ
jgi:putative tryptophan/tyrosine transport system substrate-binding protein